MSHQVNIRNKIYERLKAEKGTEMSFSDVIESYMNKAPVQPSVKTDAQDMTQQPVKEGEPYGTEAT